MKYIFLCAIYLLFASNSFAQEVQLLIPTKVFDFPIGNSEDSFEYKPSINKDSFTQPISIVFGRDGGFYILDPAVPAFKDYSSDNHFLRNIRLDLSSYKFPYGTMQIAFAGPYNSQMSIDKNAIITNEAIFFFNKKMQYTGMSSTYLGPAEYPSVSIVGFGTFFWDSELRIFCNPFPILGYYDESKKNIMDEKALREYLKKTDNLLKGVSLDDSGILYVDGKPFLDNPRAYKKYFSTIDPEWLKNEKKGKFFRAQIKLGTDEKGRTIWGGPGSWIAIMSSDAKWVSAYRIQPSDTIIWGTPAMHPNGDIYLIGYPQDGETALYRVKKAW